MVRSRRPLARLLAPFAAALSLAVIPATVSRSTAAVSHAEEDLSGFVGNWTPDKTSDAQFVGHHFVVDTSVDSPRSLVTDPQLQAQFDNYCNPNVAGTPVTYFILSYSWPPTGAMGGCKSPATKGHVYLWGSHDDIAYVHPSTVDGEAVLKGGWGIEDFSADSPSITYKKITAHRPVVNFVTHVKVSEVVRQHSHQYRQTEISGVGEVRLNSRPPQGCSAQDWDASSADGSIDLEITKVGGPNFIDLYDLTLAIRPPTDNKFAICEPGGFGYADAIRLTVKKADPSEKDACPKGSHGFLSLESHKDANGGDNLVLSLPKCKLDVELEASKTRKGDHFAVVLDLNRNGY